MKCAECGKKLKWPYFGVWTAKNGTKGWYCSSHCCIAHSGLPGIQNNGINSCVTAIVMLPFVLGWGAVKLAFKALGKLGKLACKAACNKWVWTIFSCELAWAAWKALDKIYAPKN